MPDKQRQLTQGNANADELAKFGADGDGALFAEAVAQDVKRCREKIHAASHCGHSSMVTWRHGTTWMRLKRNELPKWAFAGKKREGVETLNGKVRAGKQRVSLRTLRESVVGLGFPCNAKMGRPVSGRAPLAETDGRSIVWCRICGGYSTRKL